jgi:hypothetical protein
MHEQASCCIAALSRSPFIVGVWGSYALHLRCCTDCRHAFYPALCNAQMGMEGNVVVMVPDLLAPQLLDGCDTKEEIHFYINRKNFQDAFNYTMGQRQGRIMRSNRLFLPQGKDDDIFRLHKTDCWKVAEE